MEKIACAPSGCFEELATEVPTGEFGAFRDQPTCASLRLRGPCNWGRKLPGNVGVYQSTWQCTPEYLGVCTNATHDSPRSRNVSVHV